MIDAVEPELLSCLFHAYTLPTVQPPVQSEIQECDVSSLSLQAEMRRLQRSGNLTPLKRRLQSFFTFSDL